MTLAAALLKRGCRSGTSLANRWTRNTLALHGAQDVIGRLPFASYDLDPIKALRFAGVHGSGRPRFIYPLGDHSGPQACAVEIRSAAGEGALRRPGLVVIQQLCFRGSACGQGSQGQGSEPATRGQVHRELRSIQGYFSGMRGRFSTVPRLSSADIESRYPSSQAPDRLEACALNGPVPRSRSGCSFHGAPCGSRQTARWPTWPRP